MLEKVRKALYQWDTHRKNQLSIDYLEKILKTNDPILLVHQMGRAGSMTTVDTLRAAGLDLPIFHTHWLHPDSLKTRLSYASIKGMKESRYPLNVRTSIRISEHLQRVGAGSRDWHIVSVFREPVARNMSVFFLSINAFIKDFFDRHESGNLSDEEILQTFLKQFPHDQPVQWFDQEIRDTFGIDVYDFPFPVDQGYQVIRQDNISLLLIKVEDLNQCYADAFEDFFGVRVPELKQTHITERDPSYSMYKDFIANNILPNEYLDRMYGTPFSKHFYSVEEIATFRDKWGKTASTD